MGDVTDSSLTTPPPPPPPPPPASSSAATATPTPPSRPTPVREDCWSEDATATLIESWGRRYVELNRGNLRQKDWQDVADAVNALHGLTKKTHRTDVQCKNRIDTIKKKYKLEKARVSSNPSLSSSWTFFDRLDVLIGPSLSAKKPPPPSPSLSPSPPVAVPLLPYRKAIVALPQKRSAPTPPRIAASSDEGFFRRNYSAMAAAAAAAEVDDDEDDDFDAADEEEEEELDAAADEEEEGEEGMRRLAKAIAGLGEVYEKVEAEKLRHMVELEKQRMQFAKDLEVQRMRMFTDTQLQLERIKRAKRSSSNDIYG